MILGLLGALVIAAIGFINDSVLRLTMLVGNHFPISVFGLLILLVIALNPLLSLIRRSWRFQPGELAVIVTFMLVACSIPGSGLLRTYTPMMAMPISHEQIKPGWQRSHVLDRLPPDTLVPRIENAESPGRLVPDPDVMGPLATGYANSTEPLPIQEMFSRRVPWAKWSGPLLMWTPLVLLMSLGVICLSLVVHPQWSQREHLRYPIADFATTLMRDDPAAKNSFLRNRLFWLGAGGHSGDSRHQRDSHLVPAVRRGPARDRPDAGGQVLALLQDVGWLVVGLQREMVPGGGRVRVLPVQRRELLAGHQPNSAGPGAPGADAAGSGSGRHVSRGRAGRLGDVRGPISARACCCCTRGGDTTGRRSAAR